jgi:hypothetical protein
MVIDALPLAAGGTMKVIGLGVGGVLSATAVVAEAVADHAVAVAAGLLSRARTR